MISHHRIDACIDSHVHWAATGEWSTRLPLHRLNSPHQFATQQPDGQHWHGEWLVGAGWDDSAWSEAPTRDHLDRQFPDRPVALYRVDHHALWVNSEALRRAGLWTPRGTPDVKGGKVLRGADGWPTGVLVDRAMEAVVQLIPPAAGMELRRNLLKAIPIFNRAGFTHIRDMTCDAAQWQEAVRIDESGLLTLAVEEYFWLRDLNELDALLKTMTHARAQATPNLRVKGPKIFLDGALGSEGAWLSQCYCDTQYRGLSLWERGQVAEVLRRAWELDLEVAAHAIGDAAADQLIDVMSDLASQGLRGRAHIEHAEVLRPETIAKMKSLAVECHLQPSHWLSDRAWLKRKLGDLTSHAFPWRRLQEADVAFDFGSDSPIERADLGRTLRALRESADAGVPRLLGHATSYMSHRDLSWAPNSFTLIDEEQPIQVVFRGEHLL